MHDHLRLSISSPGVMYGLPKIHKDNVPLRPILSSIGTAGYKISKFILPYLTPFTTNQYTVQDSFSFVKDIINTPNSNSYVMASFYIKSLFTNIPLNETINIASDSLYDSNIHDVPFFSKLYFRNLLEMAFNMVLFIFNNVLYSQFNGPTLRSNASERFLVLP